MRTMVVRTAAWQQEGSRFKSPGARGILERSLPVLSPCSVPQYKHMHPQLTLSLIRCWFLYVMPIEQG